MSYAQRKEMSGNRTVAIIIVALLHAVLGYALVTGLAYNIVKKAAEDLKTFNVEDEPPPPEEVPPPPEEVPETPPQVVSPPPIVRTNVAPPPPMRVVREAPPPVVTYTAPPAPPRPPAPPPPPPAPPKVVTKAQSARGSLQGLFNTDDYPSDALSNEDEGSTTVRLSIGTDGRVTGCTVSSSSGSRSLDNATCRVLRSRARFTPAKLSNGQPTTDSYTQRITWRLE
jgi:protein TonB